MRLSISLATISVKNRVKIPNAKARLLKNTIFNPKSKASAAPNPAPLATPSISGLASGFRKIA